MRSAGFLYFLTGEAPLSFVDVDADDEELEEDVLAAIGETTARLATGFDDEEYELVASMFIELDDDEDELVDDVDGDVRTEKTEGEEIG